MGCFYHAHEEDYVCVCVCRCVCVCVHVCVCNEKSVAYDIIQVYKENYFLLVNEYINT